MTTTKNQKVTKNITITVEAASRYYSVRCIGGSNVTSIWFCSSQSVSSVVAKDTNTAGTRCGGDWADYIDCSVPMTARWIAVSIGHGITAGDATSLGTSSNIECKGLSTTNETTDSSKGICMWYYYNGSGESATLYTGSGASYDTYSDEGGCGTESEGGAGCGGEGD